MHKIWRYYDIDTLSQGIIDSELTRLHKEIEAVEETLIYTEDKYPDNPDKIEFYKKRDKVRDQLDAIYSFFSLVDQIRQDDIRKNEDLKILYGSLPDWKKNQLKKERSYPFYLFKYKL